MTRDDFEAMLTSLASRWTSRDYGSVIEYFAGNVVYSDPLNYRFADRESLLAFFQDDDGRDQTCEFHNAVFDESRQKGAAEYSYKGTYLYHGTVWIDVQEGLIVRWREYQHKSQKTWEEFWNIDERGSS